MLKRANLTLWLSALPLWLLVQYAKENPSFTEQYYSQFLYPWVFKLHQWVFDLLPFSYGDVLYLVFILFGVRLIKNKIKHWWIKPWSFIYDSVAGIILVLWIFHLSWGFNYYRESLSEQYNISTKYSEDELTHGLNQLIKKANELHKELVSSDSLPVKATNSKSFFLNNTRVHHPTQPAMTIESSKVKKSLFSLPLSYMGYAGYLNPLTLESQVNSKMPTLNLVTTLLHETAHQMGYASEKEANFIAYRSAIKNDNPYIRYAGYTFALRYFYSELSKANEPKADELAKKINPGVLKNFREATEFWEKYDNPFEVIFDKTYDTYLKANGQSSGIKSYNEMVGLVINYHEHIEAF